MAGFGAEMRHVDHGGGIVGQNLKNSAGVQPGQPLARLQHGQGAKQPASIKGFGNIGHGRADTGPGCPCPQGCDQMSRGPPVTARA